MEQKDRYLKLNSELVEEPKLSSRAKLLYGFVESLSRQNGYCYATNKYFAVKLGVCRKTITRDLKSLMKMGLIVTRIETDEKGNRMRFIFASKCPGGSTPVSRPMGRACPAPRDTGVPHNNKKKNSKNDISYEAKFTIDWN